MSNFLVRPYPVADHPLAERAYRLPTPSIEACHALITQALDTRRTGVMIYGRQRLGKTTAIEYLETVLSADRPKLPIIQIRCRFRRVPSEIAFFTHLLTSVRHKVPSGRDTEMLRQRLLHRLLEMTDIKGSSQILLLADEAQNLARADYEWLRDIHDDLKRWGKTMLVVLVGQNELHGQRSTFQRDGSMQIVSRFMVHELSFRGIRSAEDCATCLQGYDLQAYPEDSDWCHTRFFFPVAFHSGFRLANEGAKLWYAFEQAHRATLLPERLEIGMEHFTLAVEHLLLTNYRADAGVFSPSVAMWRSAVSASGFAESVLSEGSVEDS